MWGGCEYPWKRQTIDCSRGPVGDYSKLRQPLPHPPRGYSWEKKGNEWSLMMRDGDDDKNNNNNRNTAAETDSGGIEKTGAKTDAKTTKEVSKNDPLLLPEIQQQHTATTTTAAVIGKTSSAAKEGVDYVVHKVLPTDTLEGICIMYKISATELRQVNKFSGTNLHLAPSQLVIPLPNNNADSERLHATKNPSTNEKYKLRVLRLEFPNLGNSDLKAYLQINNGDLDATIADIQEDVEWEKAQKKENSQESASTAI